MALQMEFFLSFSFSTLSSFSDWQPLMKNFLPELAGLNQGCQDVSPECYSLNCHPPMKTTQEFAAPVQTFIVQFQHILQYVAITNLTQNLVPISTVQSQGKTSGNFKRQKSCIYCNSSPIRAYITHYDVEALPSVNTTTSYIISEKKHLELPNLPLKCLVRTRSAGI